MSLELENLLLDKPVTLCYWELEIPMGKLKDYFERETEWRMFNTPEELHDWLNYVEVKNLIVGTENTEKLMNFKQVLERISLEKRRELFFILVSPLFHTLDPRESFVYSANLVINPSDLEEFEKIYSRAQLYWERLYRPYRSAFEKLKEVLS